MKPECSYSTRVLPAPARSQGQLCLTSAKAPHHGLLLGFRVFSLPAGHVTLLERHNGLVHAAVYALPEDSPETLTLAPLAPPALLELRQAVAAPDPAGSVFGAEAGGPVLEGPGGTLKPFKTLDPASQAEEEAYSLALGKQGPWQSDVVRLVYSSLVTPESTYDVDVRTGGAQQRLQATSLVGCNAVALHARLHALAGLTARACTSRGQHAGCSGEMVPSSALDQSTEVEDRRPATAWVKPEAACNSLSSKASSLPLTHLSHANMPHSECTVLQTARLAGPDVIVSLYVLLARGKGAEEALRDRQLHARPVPQLPHLGAR